MGEPTFRRYLVTRDLVVHEDDEMEVVRHKAGDELLLIDEIATAVKAREPGALIQMEDPKPDQDA